MSSNEDVGDVLFFAGDKGKFIDRVIMQRTKSTYVHVAVVIAPGLIIQAVTGGVQIAKVPNTYTVIAHVGRDLYRKAPLECRNAMRDLMCLAGSTPYGVLDIVSQALMLLPGNLTISANRSYDCSHLATLWLQSAGMDLPFGTEANRVTPGSLYEMLVSAGTQMEWK